MSSYSFYINKAKEDRNQLYLINFEWEGDNLFNLYENQSARDYFHDSIIYYIKKLEPRIISIDRNEAIYDYEEWLERCCLAAFEDLKTEFKLEIKNPNIQIINAIEDN